MNYKHNNDVNHAGVNESVLVGKVVKLFIGWNGEAILTLDCSRKNYPKVVVPKSLYEKRPMLVEGAKVYIMGAIRSTRSACGRYSYSIVADELDVLDEDDVGLYRHEFYLCSKINAYKRYNDKIVLYTEVTQDGITSYVPVTLPKKHTKLYDDLTKFKTFRGCGTIETGNYIDATGKKKFYENYVAQSYHLE